VLHEGDFLEICSSAQSKFDVVLANPPFTRNHDLDPLRRQELRERFKVYGPAGLWVHFLHHSMSFLKVGGRLASIVPASALFTEYGNVLLERLCENFSKVDLFRLQERQAWTGGASERGALILAEGYRQGQCAKVAAGAWVTSVSSPSVVVGSDVAAYGELKSSCEALEDLATLSIGAVTGCNKVFLLSEQERLDYGISLAEVTPIVTRARQITGITISPAELLQLGSAGHKTWLLTPERNTGSAAKRLRLISADVRENTTWFKKRRPWWKVNCGPAADAVFTYMNGNGPRLVLAAEPVFCTNTLHRVVFDEDVSTAQRWTAALTLVSTFGQLSAERIGRSYGGGVLKFELSEARRMPVLPANDRVDNALYSAVDEALRNGDADAARKFADHALLSKMLGRSWKTAVREMWAEVLSLRAMRES